MQSHFSVFRCTATVRLLVLGFLLGAMLLSGGGAAFSQNVNTAAATLDTTSDLSSAKSAIGDARTTVDNLKAKAEEENLKDSDLVEISVQLEDLSERMRALVATLEPRLQGIKTREEELGPKPTDGQPLEPQSLVDQRDALALEKSEINTDLGEATAVADEADELVQVVTEMRRELFTENLFGRTTITAETVKEAHIALNAEIQAFGRKVSSWFEFTWQHKRTSFLLAIGLSIVLALLFIVAELPAVFALSPSRRR